MNLILNVYFKFLILPLPLMFSVMHMILINITLLHSPLTFISLNLLLWIVTTVWIFYWVSILRLTLFLIFRWLLLIFIILITSFIRFILIILLRRRRIFIFRSPRVRRNIPFMNIFFIKVMFCFNLIFLYIFVILFFCWAHILFIVIIFLRPRSIYLSFNFLILTIFFLMVSVPLAFQIIMSVRWNSLGQLTIDIIFFYFNSRFNIQIIIFLITLVAFLRCFIMFIEFIKLFLLIIFSRVFLSNSSLFNNLTLINAWWSLWLFMFLYIIISFFRLIRVFLIIIIIIVSIINQQILFTSHLLNLVVITYLVLNCIWLFFLCFWSRFLFYWVWGVFL